MIQLIAKFNTISLLRQGIYSLVSFGLYYSSSTILEKSYLLSKFPVPYFEQQTSFNAVKMKEWYAFMMQQGTFDIYLKTQFIDFAFIAAVIFMGFIFWLFSANLHPKGSFFNRWGQIFAFALPLAGAFDVLENIVSFFMIVNPKHFSEVLLFPYSGFAVLKFAFWSIALLWLLVSWLSVPFTTKWTIRKARKTKLF